MKMRRILQKLPQVQVFSTWDSLYYLCEKCIRFRSCSSNDLFCVCIGALPEGLTRELPEADEYEKAIAIGSGETDEEEDDLEDLKKQLEALNAA